MAERIKVGDVLPEFTFFQLSEEGAPQAITTSALFANKKAVLFAVPGAFTPGCSKTHCPSFVLGAAQLKAKGVEVIACTSVNDAFVMDAWAESQKAKGKITFLADGNGDFAKKVGMELDLTAKGLGHRSKRYALILDNLVVKHVAVDESGVQETTADALLPKL